MKAAFNYYKNLCNNLTHQFWGHNCSPNFSVGAFYTQARTGFNLKPF